MKIILPLSDIPVGSKVNMLTGSKVYTVKDKLVVHNNSESDELPEMIKADGVRFLVDDRNSIGAYPETKEVVWVTDQSCVDDIISLLQEYYDFNADY